MHFGGSVDHGVMLDAVSTCRLAPAIFERSVIYGRRGHLLPILVKIPGLGTQVSSLLLDPSVVPRVLWR